MQFCFGPLDSVVIIFNYLAIRFAGEEKAKRPPLSHMPFGFGPRSCIGMRLALLQTKIALIELLKRYTFIRAPETEVSFIIAIHGYVVKLMTIHWLFRQVPVKLGVGAVIWPKNGIYLKVIDRL